MIHPSQDPPTDGRDADLHDALSGPRVPAVTGLKGLAVLLLVGGHYAVRLGADPWGASLASSSVVVLFVLTGFICTQVLLEPRAKSAIDVRNWIGRKALRTYPTLVAVLLALAVLELRGSGTPGPPERYASFLGLLGNYYYALTVGGSDPNSFWLGHLWSVMVGAQFLIPWVLVLRWARRNDRVGSLVPTLTALVVISAVLRAGAESYLGATEAYVYLSTETRVGDIALGALVAVLLRDPTRRGRVDRLLSPIAAGMLAVLTAAATVLPFGPASVLLGPVVAYITLVLVAHRTSPVTRFLDSTFMLGVAAVSYSLFAWHPFALEADRLFATLPIVPRVMMTMAVVIVFATTAYAVLERIPRAVAARLTRFSG